MAQHTQPTKKLNAIRRWYAYILAEDKLDPRNKPAPKSKSCATQILA